MQELLETGMGVKEIVGGIDLERHDGVAPLLVSLLQKRDSLIFRADA